MVELYLHGLELNYLSIDRTFLLSLFEVSFSIVDVNFFNATLDSV
jgi:hypothetical protein